LIGGLGAASVILGTAGCATPEEAPTASAAEASTRSGRHDGRDVNVAFVEAGLDAMFVDLDPNAVDRYLAPSFIEHDPLFANGLEPQRAIIRQLKTNSAFSYRRVRALGDGDLVAVHGEIQGFFAKPAAVFDLFRLENGKIVEHWDAIQQEEAPNPSGRTMLDGPTYIEGHSRGRAEQNKTIADRLVETTLVDREASRLGEFISANTYLQHHPGVGDGLANVQAFLSAGIQNDGLRYLKIHHTLGQGNFVLLHSEGEADGAKLAFFDLWRVEGGKMVEHWDVVQPVPASSANDNGFF
jgi:predicted SnoaL-like aldol condensation-catalyzing enzyme